MKQQFLSFSQLVRLPNLVLIALSLILLRCLILEHTQMPVNKFVAMIFGTILIAAAGNILNDILDIEIDKINKPNRVLIGNFIASSTAWKWYFFLNFIAIFLAIWIGGKSIVFFFGTAILLLFFYSKYWKKQLFIGNLIVAFLCAWVLVEFWWIERAGLTKYWSWILWAYIFFAFFSTLFREQIKDLEDMEGDRQQGCKTLPIVVGEKNAKVLAIISAGLLCWSLFVEGFLLFSYEKQKAVYYLSFCLILPLLVLIFKTFHADSKEKYYQLSQAIKWYMLLGLGLLFLV